MERFDDIVKPNRTEESMSILLDCTRIAMKQYYPTLKTVEDIEDSMDIKTMYRILDVAGGVKLDKTVEELEQDVKRPKADSGPSWNEFDIVKVESELFLLGIWKDYEDLESSLSLPELTQTLNAKRDLDYQDKKFMAAMQGVDLDEQTSNSKGNEWEAMQARVAAKISGISVVDANDITAFQGIRAEQSGFGIGLGIDYEKV